MEEIREDIITTTEENTENPEQTIEAVSEDSIEMDFEVTREPVKAKKRGVPGIRRSGRKIAVAMIAACAVLCSTIIGSNKFVAMYPYALTMDNEPICYVESKEAAEEVMAELVQSFSEEGTEVKAVNSDNRLQVARAEDRNVDEDQLKTKEEAVELVAQAAEETKDTDKPLEFTITSTKIADRDVTLDTVYEKDETMLAGTGYVKVEGEDRKEKVLEYYTTTNGEVVDKDVTVLEVMDEGVNEVIVKGTLGVPDGEDWRTYEGDPVFNSGDDLVTTGKQYIGKVRYKLGGMDLTRGVSCLGLVKALYAKYGIYLPMSHPGMKKAGIGVSYSNARPGDIICYKAHVGIYVGNGKMLDATSGSGVSIRSVSTKKLVTVRRIVGN